MDQVSVSECKGQKRREPIREKGNLSMNRKKVNMMIRIIVILAIVIIAAAAVIFIGKNKLDAYKAEINDYVYEIESNRQIVYVVKDGVEIQKGEVIVAEGDEANVMRQEIYSGLEPDYYIQAEDIGSIAVVDIPSGEPITKNMVTTLIITHDTREYEVSVVDLMVDQRQNDYIDVRIMFPNGEDYLVLAKKQIKKLVLDSSIFYTYLNEEEILRLASATVDAYCTTGAKIYATRYVESNIQKDATPDYLVSAQVIDRMVSDPNIVSLAQDTMNLQARMSLEQRLSGLTEDQLAAVAEGHGLYDTAKTQVITQGVKYALEDGSVEEKDPETDVNSGKTTSDTETPTESSVTSDTVNSTTSDNTGDLLSSVTGGN